jgi:hypothetical protein
MLAYGVAISGSGANMGGNWTIRGGYVAMSGLNGDSAIYCANAAASSQNRGNIINGVTVLAYAGATCLRGVNMTGAEAKNNVITNNTIQNFATKDIEAQFGANIVTGNQCLSAIANNILARGVIADNVGSVQYQRALFWSNLGGIKVTVDEAIPLVGTWAVGDLCWKINPVASGIPGWVCTAAGTPGTWKTMAALGA